MSANRLIKLRLDRSQLTPEGYLKAMADATRTGVLTYSLPDGTVRRELRPASEVFLPASMETLKGKPVTEDHPAVPVTAENAQTLARGWTHDNVEQNGDKLSVGVTIMDAALIDAIQAGKQEVSCGYAVDLEMVPGRYEGQDYDAVQRNIRYNHLAIVPRGRAGSDVRLRLDAAEEIPAEEKKMTTAKVKLGRSGIECDLPIEAASAVSSAFRADMMTIEELEAQVKALQGEVEALKGAKAGLEQQVEDKDGEIEKMKEDLMSEEKMDAAIEERLDLRQKAESILEAGKYDLRKMNAQQIKRACIAAKMPGLNLDSRSVDFVNGCFDALALTPKTTVQAGTTTTERNDATVNNSVEARKAAMTRDQNAWKRKA